MADIIKMCEQIEERFNNFKPAPPKIRTRILYWDEVDEDRYHQIENDWHYHSDCRMSDPVYDSTTHTYESHPLYFEGKAMNFSTGRKLNQDCSKYYSNERTVSLLTEYDREEPHTWFRTEFLDDLKVFTVTEIYIEPDKLNIRKPNKWQTGHILITDSDRNIYVYEPENKRAVYYEKLPVSDMYQIFLTRTLDDCCHDSSIRNFDDNMLLDMSPAGNLYPAVYYCKLGHAREAYRTFEDFVDFLNAPKTRQKTTKAIQALIDKPLPDTSCLQSAENDRPLIIQKVEDGLCVVRMFKQDYNENVMSETCRIYIDKTHVTPCAQSGDHWVKKNLKTNGNNWCRTILPFNKDDVKGTKLEYVADLLETYPHGELLWGILRDPLVEQLAKLGAGEMLVRCCGNYSKLEDSLTSCLGPYKPDGTPGKRLGLNNYQLKRFISVMNNDGSTEYNIIGRFRSFFVDGNIFQNGYYYTHTYDNWWIDLSSMDNDTFDTLLDYLSLCNHGFFDDLFNIGRTIRMAYGMNRLMIMLPKLEHLATYPSSLWHTYYDYLTMNVNMHEHEDDCPLLSCDFDENHTQDSIKNMHDALLDVYNLKQNQIEEERFKKAGKRAKKLEYSDNEYMIKAPETAQDLINEGINLHHCVGSYVARVTEGITNILFLRQKNAPETSFYTIEVDPDHIIQQVHGFGNVNLTPGSSEEAFVKKWAENKNLKTGRYNQVR